MRAVMQIIQQSAVLTAKPGKYQAHRLNDMTGMMFSVNTVSST